ncbi:MAG: hypothetical protein HYY65_04270 [Candidatus Tectomicrobia bacterium]|uniref:Lipoprotein n=1 Tax=Tectimicrobiota bacterium TaxID=2528274 RepID=A0A932GNP7_UNCTE|nr:hypothetical protein [Candidatus Tectomicrobia bacterium]
MKRHWAWGLAAAALLTAISGCTYFPGAGTEPVPQVSPTFRFEDVPVPPTMELDTRQSFVYESNVIRAGVLIYRGNEKYEELLRFFRENLKQYNWRQVSSFEHEGALLNYEKPGWSLSIEVRRELGSNLLVIRYGPKQT